MKSGWCSSNVVDLYLVFLSLSFQRLTC
jgi:hypothetical protein